jgi:hypothetical protein
MAPLATAADKSSTIINALLGAVNIRSFCQSYLVKPISGHEIRAIDSAHSSGSNGLYDQRRTTMASLRKRGKIYYASYYAGGKEQRRSLETASYHVARERIRNLEGARARGTLDDDLPTKTPVPRIVEEYAAHILNTKSRNVPPPLTRGKHRHTRCIGKGPHIL